MELASVPLLQRACAPWRAVVTRARADRRHGATARACTSLHWRTAKARTKGRYRAVLGAVVGRVGLLLGCTIGYATRCTRALGPLCTPSLCWDVSAGHTVRHYQFCGNRRHGGAELRVVAGRPAGARDNVAECRNGCLCGSAQCRLGEGTGLHWSSLLALSSLFGWAARMRADPRRGVTSDEHDAGVG